MKQGSGEARPGRQVGAQAGAFLPVARKGAGARESLAARKRNMHCAFAW